MTRTIKLALAVAAASALFVGCGWPDTKMEPVGGTQVQTNQSAPPPATNSATDDSTKKKTNG